MFKILAFAITLSVGATLLCAQTTSKYADTPKNGDPAVRTVTDEDKAEAKRLYKEGVKYGLAGLFAQAVEVLQRSVKLNPQNGDAHYALGHAYYDLKQWRNAIESFKVAVDLNPKDQEARDRLGLARAMLWEEDNVKYAKRRRTAVTTTPPPAPVSQQVALSAKVPPKPEPTAEPVAVDANAAAANEAPKEALKETPKETPKESPKETPKEVPAETPAEIPLTKIYRVGPSDVLDVRINESASQSTLFTVTPTGFLEHPLLPEPLQVRGLTVDEIGAAFEAELKRRALVENPKVTVGVRDYGSHMILVSGLVKDSGTKILRREAIPLYVVVADAQPLPEAARVTVLRNESNQTFEIDLTEAKEMNLLVRPGDVITLHPSVTQFVYIGGEVKSPGEKIYRRGLTLTQALLAAGGVMPKAKEARLGRDNGEGFLAVTRYKLKEIESGKVPDPVVKPGDRIMIRE